jgi:hypothetical protein
VSADSAAALRARRREAGEPIENREAVRARMREYRARLREASGKPPRRKGRARVLQPFLGIDGEGCGKDRQGRQHYKLMCAGNKDGFWELYTGKPLSTYECLDFICDLPGTKDGLLVGFVFGYDVTMILADLPSAKWDDLTAEKGVDSFDATPDQARYHKPMGRWTWFWPPPPPGAPPLMFGIEYRAHNYFKVCRMEHVTLSNVNAERRDDASPPPANNLIWRIPKPVPGSSRTIYESFGFFQRKFARALQDFDAGTKADRQMIARNKAERATFKSITREVRDYCALECELLADMMETFRGNCLAVRSDFLPDGIKPRTWNGPGKLATALHKAHDTMTTDRLATWVPSGLLLMAQAAYYGGRFEMPRVGLICEPVYEYDLNSAYPACMLSLPCLEHGKWRYCDGEEIRKLHKSNPDALYVASVAYQHTHAGGCRGMCGLPHRQTGRESNLRREYAGVLAWPLQGVGTYWSVEIRSAELLGAQLRFGPGWAYSTDCDCKPFAWVEALYLERLRLGSRTTGYPLKLAINSLYGKLAQRIGNPRYANKIWAGLITAMTRARLNEAIAQNPQAIAMIATDGIYSVAPLNLPISKNLGEWGMERHDAGLMLVQPGLYWPLARGGKPKTRGISAGFFTRRRRLVFERAWQGWAAAWAAAGTTDDIAATWEHMRQFIRPPDVDVPIHLFVGRPLAEARGKPETARMWIDTHKTISFDWHGKRGNHIWQNGPHVRTHPLPGGPTWASASYDAEAIITDTADWAGAEFEDQPDYWQQLDDE